MIEARKLAAIMAIDVVGYSRLMGEDESGTARAVREHREAIRPLVANRAGRIVKTMGDGLLLEFPSVVDAVECAIAIQKLMVDRNGASPDAKRIVYRIGVHLGDVLIEGDDILGESVNVAARLEGICEPGGVLISGSAHEHVRGRIAAGFVDLGHQDLKNIVRPLRAYQVQMTESGVTAAPTVRAKTTPRLALPDKPSIAVLAFQNVGGDPEQEYFSDGIAEDLITSLSRLRAFFVIARNSSFTYKNRPTDVRQVGRELGVRYVLSGSVRRVGARLRITAQLVEAETGSHVWAERFEGDVAEIFDLQDRVTIAIANAIEPNLRVAEFARTRSKPTKDLTAYDLYLQALFKLGSINKVRYDEAMSLLHEALHLDSGFADAMALLAATLGQSAQQGWVDVEKQAEALDLARQAVHLDRLNPNVLAIAAASEAAFAGSFELSDLYADQALRLAPDSMQVRVRCGLAFNLGGRCDEAVGHFEAAIRLSPMDVLLSRAYQGLAVGHFFGGRFEHSIQWSRRVLEQNPAIVVTRRFLCAALALAGHIDEAKVVMFELRQLAPTSSIARSAKSNFRHQWQMDMYLDGLRLAGLPEQSE